MFVYSSNQSTQLHSQRLATEYAAVYAAVDKQEHVCFLTTCATLALMTVQGSLSFIPTCINFKLIQFDLFDFI